MQNDIQRVASRYLDLYRKVYNREPKDLRVLDNNFVVVNHVQLRLTDLETLCEQLEEEYRSLKRQKRNTITRLMQWLRQA